MNYNAEYIALHIINEALTESISAIDGHIECCGKLDHQETKLSEKAKSYFSQQTDDYKESAAIVRRIQREINVRLWENINNDPKLKEPGVEK